VRIVEEIPNRSSAISDKRIVTVGEESVTFACTDTETGVITAVRGHLPELV